MRLEDLPEELRPMGRCSCLANVQPADHLVGASLARRFTIISMRAERDAAGNCSRCGGTGLDQARLTGVLAAALPAHSVIHTNSAGCAISHAKNGVGEMITGDTLLEALLKAHKKIPLNIQPPDGFLLAAAFAEEMQATCRDVDGCEVKLKDFKPSKCPKDACPRMRIRESLGMNPKSLVEER